MKIKIDTYRKDCSGKKKSEPSCWNSETKLIEGGSHSHNLVDDFRQSCHRNIMRLAPHHYLTRTKASFARGDALT